MEDKGTVAEKLDKDFDQFFDKMLEKNKSYRYESPLSEDNWEEELENIPLFMTKAPGTIDADQSPDLAALQAIKYEEDDPQAKALLYKDDGNEEFKKGNYKKAIKLYSEAIKIKCGDANVMSTLFTNRANAHFRIGNYRSSLCDATEAKAIEPNYSKAIFRGACSCFELGLYDEAITWCKEGLIQDSSTKTFQDLLKKATLRKKQEERDKRKKKSEEHKKNLANERLLDAIESRGVKLQSLDEREANEDEDGLDSKLGALNVLNIDTAYKARVYLDEHNTLHWPVLFIYPEYGQTDYIEDFQETNSFSDHIQVMFGCEKAPWDKEDQYKPSRLEICFEDVSENSLVFVGQTLTLQQTLSHPRYIVTGGTPSFIILVKDSPFQKQFRDKYNIRR